MDEKSLHEALMQAGVLYKAQSLWMFDPALQDLVYRYTELVGTKTITSTGEPLLQQSIKDAVSGYKHALDHSQNQRDARLLFLNALVVKAIEIFLQHLIATYSNHSVIWNPFQCGALEFEQNHSGGSFRVENNSALPDHETVVPFLFGKLQPHGYLDIPDSE